MTRINATLCYADAANELLKNREQFTSNVKSSMRGNTIKGISYANVIARS
jgi:ubiquitin-conjugating enzyme E2 M